jgi:glycosyltransferase involved in cell wall biosynthesis
MPRHFEEIVAGFDVPVTYSPYAQGSVMRTMGFEIPMIPISHDPRIFYPRDKKKSLDSIGFPTDKFIIAMVATNQSRKSWPCFIEAAARVARRHDDVLILPWTTWTKQISGGFDIPDLIYRNDIPTRTIDPGGAVHRFTDEQMACLYAGIDVLVLATVGEGAGLPPIRARACGTPALVSANTACIDFAADDFELVRSSISHTDNGNNLIRYGTSVDDLEAKLEHLYNDRKHLKELGEIGHEHSKQFEIDVCNAEWDALLEMI